MTANDREPISRRHFLSTQSLGIAPLAFLWLLQQEADAEPLKPTLVEEVFDTTPKAPHKPPQATAMISLWMQGGPSHLDLCDPKPELQKRDGETYPGEIKYDNAAQASSRMLACPWKFQAHGQCGMELSELLPHLSTIVDDITLIRSMRTGVNNHGQSIRAMNTGGILGGQPTLGSWVTYGLGAESQDLPAYMALIDPGQLPVLGVENWAQGWLPPVYQGTVVRPQEPRMFNLDPQPNFGGPVQKGYLGFLEKLNRRHADQFARKGELEARLASYRLAARMQTAAKEALDLSGESEGTRQLYGLDRKETADFGARCLIARRLIERGVRFVQVFTQNQFWDHHNAIRRGLPAACLKVDQPAAALVRDLKQRGLLDTTIVHWGGEMGRLPVIQNDVGPDKVGRDHNTNGFSMWVAGGGFRSGYIHGATDEFGHQAVENVVNHYDYHATLMHLLGLDPERLKFRRNGQPRAMVNIEQGRVVQDLLA